MEPTHESPYSEPPKSPQQVLLEADATAFPAFWQNLQNQTVLLVGWGHGHLAESLVDAGNTVTCIEASLDLISKARDFIESHNVEMIHGDFLTFQDFSPHQFSAVVTSLVAEPVKDLPHLFRQAAAVLVNNGILYLSEVHTESAPPANHIHSEEAITLAATQAGLDLERTETSYGADLKAQLQMWEFRTR
ncbi:class I SAM-dependent methyltransferase [Bdellovibrio bacteriovorus]|uniref:class I SAM-dependent methyltransferase n=1 Tax=Bdellovibrio bacteriovorus TaxID=959 RepID=UPI003A80D2CA